MTAESKTEGAAYVPNYDVFISYAHKNKDIMNSIREKLDPSLQVFLDSEELRHGFQWQQVENHDDVQLISFISKRQIESYLARHWQFSYFSPSRPSDSKYKFPKVKYD